MLMQPDCFPCVLNMALSTIRRLNLDEETERHLYSKVLNLPHLKGDRWDITNEEIIETVIRVILDDIGNPDPFHALKRKQNDMMMKISSLIQNKIDTDPDPLFTALKAATLGNAIDVMVSGNSLDLENNVMKMMNATFPGHHFSPFRSRLGAAQSVLYFTDNAGEIVFDKLFIDTIKKMHNVEITAVVRSHPVLNDATLEEAGHIGLQNVVPVIENGIDGPLPGTILGRCSDQVRRAVRQADLIISKGGANFDTLDEERKRMPMNITFMFLSKCLPYCRLFNTELHRPILANFYTKT
ncbi:MAG: DUF89 family protein [Deltaproteobacteria bacterium]|nr:DUF89 family protein [Deltaproteobacteria bacterium]